MKTLSHIDIYQLVTDLIIEKMEQGKIPWKQPWNTYGPALIIFQKSHIETLIK